MEHRNPIFTFLFGASTRRREEDNEMDDDDVPPLESLTDINPRQQDVDMDMAPPESAAQAPPPAAPAPHHHRVTVEEIPDEEATPPPSSSTSAYSTPLLTPPVMPLFQRSSTRRPRVDEDDDRERDRRHPSERVVTGSGSGMGTAADALRSAAERDMRRREALAAAGNGNDNSQDGSSIRVAVADHSSIIPQSHPQNHQQQQQPPAQSQLQQQQPPRVPIIVGPSNPAVLVVPNVTVTLPLPATIVPAFIPGTGIRPVVVLDATSSTPASPAIRTAASAMSHATPAPVTTPTPVSSTSTSSNSTNQNGNGNASASARPFRFFRHAPSGVGLGLSAAGGAGPSQGQPQAPQHLQQDAPPVAQQPPPQQQQAMEVDFQAQLAEVAAGLINGLFGGARGFQVDIVNGPPPVPASADANANPNAPPTNAPPNAPPNPNAQDPEDQRPLPLLTDLIQRLTGATPIQMPMPGGTIPFFFPFLPREREVDDPERAKRFVRGLESVPEGLVRRLERVGKMGEGEGEGGCGDGGCAICWERLLDEEEEGSEGEGEGSEHEGEHEEHEGEDKNKEKTDDAPLPKIVSLPCAHVFHSRCLIPWFSKPRQTTCPTCRFNIDPEGLMKRTPRPVEEAEEVEEEVPTEPNTPVVERDPFVHVQYQSPEEAQAMAQQQQQGQAQVQAQQAQPQQPQPQAQQQEQQRQTALPGPGRDFFTLGFGFDIIIAGGPAPLPVPGPGMNEGAGGRQVNVVLNLGPDGRLRQVPQPPQQQGLGAQQPQPQEHVQLGQGEQAEEEQEEIEMDTMIIDGPEGLDEREILADFRRFLEGRGAARQAVREQAQAQAQAGASGSQVPQPPRPASAPVNDLASQVRGSAQDAAPQVPTQGNEPRPRVHRVISGGFSLPLGARPMAGPRVLSDTLTTIFGFGPRHEQGQAPAPAQGQGQQAQGHTQAQAQGQPQVQQPQQQPQPTHQQIHDHLAREILAGEQRIQYIRERTEQLREALGQGAREGGEGPATAPAPAAGDNANANPTAPNPNAPAGARDRRGIRSIFGMPMPLFDIPLGPMPFGPRPPRQRSESKKAWTLPPAPGLSLRQRIEKKEQEAGLRCSEISCGVGPSDEDPVVAEAEHGLKQLSIHDKTNRPVCGHKFHSSCLVTAERVVLDGADVPVVGEDVEVSCPVCKSGGCVSKRDWEEGVRALQ